MNEPLSVFLADSLVGVLEPVRNGARFHYVESVAAAHPGSPFLSCALPVQERAFDTRTTATWFSGLLPEDARLDEVRRFYGIVGETYLDVLKEIGWECAGAVSVLPDGVVPAANRGGRAKLSPSGLAARLRALPSHPFDTAASMRVSLGGFQEKLAVASDIRLSATDARIAFDHAWIPEDGSPTTHILKPQPARLPGMAESEAWAMKAAAAATPTAKVALLDLGDEDAPPTLVVERFDRAITQNGLARVHQEDCCQALGIEPERKYAAESSPKKSDPSFRGIAGLLRRYAESPSEQLVVLLRQMTANVALGNTDAHGKNYALLHRGDAVELAPLYDVVPVLEVTPGVKTMGMRVGGRILIDRIGRAELVAEARSWGLTTRYAEEAVGETLGLLRTGIEVASELYPEAGAVHADAALRRIEMLASAATKW